jgi:hypothetical protein
MSEYAPRCPFCANVLKHQPSIWERIGFKAGTVQCPTCLRKCESRDAHTMGAAYWHWAEVFRKELAQHVETLPVLSEPAMQRAMDRPNKEDTRLISSFEELVRTVLRHHRTVLIEMARGREAFLECAHLTGESNSPEIVAVLSTSAAESGERELEQLISRNGLSSFILYNYPPNAGAEPRVKRAVHSKVKTPRTLTDAHVAAMHAEPHAIHHHA